jgi:hypothetical protein
MHMIISMHISAAFQVATAQKTAKICIFTNPEDYSTEGRKDHEENLPEIIAEA